MKLAILVLIVASALLFAGCTGSAPQAPPAPPSGQAQMPAKNNTVSPPPAPPAQLPENSTPAGNETYVAPPANVPDTCTVGFQMDASNVYLVKVDTESAKPLTVRCPNGKMAELKGSLYVCTQLDIDSPVVAYLGGSECGRASFQRSAYEKKGSSKIYCTMSLSHTRITAGETSEVTIQTSTGDKEVTLTYNCGNETKTQKRAGLVTDGSICKFSTPGTYEVDAKIDGETCDSKVIEVFANAHECFVLQDTFGFAKLGSSYVYTARVAGRGYNGQDELRYRCYGSQTNVLVSAIPNSADFTTGIECRSIEGPMPENSVTVTVGNDNCGSIAVPAAQ
ncbi:Uncharacterised protein [uncultured archaeon]|nr:Uncharacterised protein [uncultured archaeon]